MERVNGRLKDDFGAPFSVANAMQTDGTPIKSSTCGSLSRRVGAPFRFGLLGKIVHRCPPEENPRRMPPA